MFSNFKIWPSRDQSGSIKARGRVTIADVVNVNFAIKDSRNGLFVSLPNHKGKDKEGNDKWYSDVFIPDEKVRKNLNQEAINAYNETVNSLNQGSGAGPDNQGIPF